MGTVNVPAEEPGPRPYGVSGEEAVEWCRKWMVYLGASETVAASGQARRLCDLYSGHYLGWVFDQHGNLDVAAVERASRLSAADGRRALIFLRGGVRPIARERADALGVALFWYDAQEGSLGGGNTVGRVICARGLIPQ